MSATATAPTLDVPVLRSSKSTGKVQIKHPLTGKLAWMTEQERQALIARMHGDQEQPPAIESLPESMFASPSSTPHPALTGLRERLTEERVYARGEMNKTRDIRIQGDYARLIGNADGLLALLDEAETIPVGTEVTFGHQRSKAFRVKVSGYGVERFRFYKLTTTDPIFIVYLRRLIRSGQEPGLREIRRDQKARFTKGERKFVGWLSDDDARDMIANDVLSV